MASPPTVLVDKLDDHLDVVTRFAKVGQEARRLLWAPVSMHRPLERPFPVVETKKVVIGTLSTLYLKRIGHWLLAHIAGNPHTSPGYFILAWTWVGAEILPKISEGIQSFLQCLEAIGELDWATCETGRLGETGRPARLGETGRPARLGDLRQGTSE